MAQGETAKPIGMTVARVRVAIPATAPIALKGMTRKIYTNIQEQTVQVPSARAGISRREERGGWFPPSPALITASNWRDTSRQTCSMFVHYVSGPIPSSFTQAQVGVLIGCTTVIRGKTHEAP